jgi:type I restriction enzyme M protein
MLDRTHKELTIEDIAMIAGTYHAWRGEVKDGVYEDVPGFCKSATLDEIKANEYVLTPGRYVGAADVDDDGELFEEKMQALVGKLIDQMDQGRKLDECIKGHLEALGHGR